MVGQIAIAIEKNAAYHEIQAAHGKIIHGLQMRKAVKPDWSSHEAKRFA